MTALYKNILFDLDGTLTDSAEGVTKSVQYALKKYNIETTLEELKPFIGPPLQRSFKEVFGFNAETVDEVIEHYREYYREKGIYQNRVYPLIPELLSELENRGINLYVATSKPTIFAEKILRHFKLDHFFKAITGSNLDGTRVEKKDVITHVLKQMEERGDNANTVMVGDRKHDILGAKACGLESIAVAYGYGSTAELEAAGPIHIAQSVEDLGKKLLGSNSLLKQ